VFFKKKLEDEPDNNQREIRRATNWFQWIWFSPIDLAGEFLDWFTAWRRTRRWLSVFAILPMLLVVLVLGSIVAVGKLLEVNAKVAWYADLANKEIALANAPKTNSETTENAKTEESAKRLPAVVDMLFRRVLQLNQNNKIARYYVADQMSRYGSRGSARQIMESLAPLKGSGHPKAHTWLAADLIDKGQKGEPINIETLKFHLKRGTSGDDVPPVLFLVYSHLLQQENKLVESQEFLKRAAQFDPKLFLTSIAVYTQNGLAAQAKLTADSLVEKVTDKSGQTSEENIVTVAQAYVLTNRIDNAIEVLKAGYMRLSQSPKLARALSDAFRLKFRASSARLNNQVQINLEFLDLAIAIDPTNILIQEELSALAQLGISQNEATVESLRVRIATLGTSFVARLLLAESSFRRGELASAINDYEVVLAELPRMTLVLNNLAMLYTQAVPPRLDRSLELIDRAIEISPAVSEFHDSRGDILAALKRKDDSVASYLVALSSSPQRIGTREKLIALYEERGQTEQAQLQRDKLAEVQHALEEQRSKTQAASGQEIPSMQSEKPSDETTPVKEETTNVSSQPEPSRPG